MDEDAYGKKINWMSRNELVVAKRQPCLSGDVCTFHKLPWRKRVHNLRPDSSSSLPELSESNLTVKFVCFRVC